MTAVESDQIVVALRGEIDMSVAPDLRDALQAMIAEGDVHLVLDMSALEFIDSAGLSVLVNTTKAALAAGGSVRLRSPRASTMRVLETTRLTDFIPVEGALDPS